MRERLTQDVRYALRQAWKYRTSTLTSLVTLTAAIGATTAIFALVSGLLLRPLPVKDSDRLVRLTEIYSPSGGELNISMTDFLDWRKRLHALSGITLFRTSQGNLTGQGAAERVETVECEINMLPLLGVSPVRGRNFSADQNEPGHAKETLISFAYWQSRFAGQDVLGRQMVIDGKPYTIIGILPDLLNMFGENDVWVPLPLDLSAYTSGRGYHWYFALGRLRPGVTLADSNHELQAISASLAAEYPATNEKISARGDDFRETVVGTYRLALIALFGVVVAVLFIACANIASLSLARASGRSREISIRVALGSTKWQLFRQLLTESFMLSTVASIAGIILAFVLVRLVTHLPALNVPLSENVQVDWRVLLFAIAIAVVTGVGFGLAPARAASHVDVADALRQATGRTTASRSQQRFRRVLVFAQGAIAALLLVTCGLLLRSFLRVSQIDPGFRPDHLLTMRLSLPSSRFDENHPGRIAAFARHVLAQVRSTPGVAEAAIAENVPLTGRGGGGGVLVEGAPQPASAWNAPFADATLVTPGYFHTLGITVLAGRDFDERDNLSSPNVAIVNRAFVSRFLHGADALTRRIALASDSSHYRQIVGVVNDVHQSSLERATHPQVFFPINQVEYYWLMIAVRTKSNPMDYAATIQNIVQKEDPEAAVFLPRTMDEIIREMKGWREFETTLIAAFAGLALLLAAVGTFSVVAYGVARRTNEIGIRIALGATQGDILKSLALEGTAPAILGAAIGTLLAFWIAKLAAALLYGIGPNDLVSYAAAVVILCLVAIAAGYIPARRAASLDPSLALRYE